MKKFISTFLLYLICAIPASAVLTTDEAVSQKYIEHHGYSSEMARLIDLQNAQVNGANPKYKDKDPAWYTENKGVNFVRNVFMYFDCGLDDKKFMQHDIKYSNRYDDI